MPTLSQNIKTEIEKLLNELRRTEVLKQVIVHDNKKDVWAYDFSGFPTAILTTPTIDNDYLTNRQNLRLYTFEILIVHNKDEMGTTDAIEELMDTIVDKFDNNPTLNGKSDGAVEPSTSPVGTIDLPGKSYIVFSVIVKARAVKDLTF